MVGNRKSETKAHSLLKHFIASILERQGHKISLEYHLSNGFPNSPIADVFDHTTSLIYEVQTKKISWAEKKKVTTYLLHTGVFDVIFIYVTEFPISLSIENLYKLLEKKLGI